MIPLVHNAYAQQTQNFCIAFAQRRPNFFDRLRRWANVAQMSYKWFVFTGHGSL